MQYGSELENITREPNLSLESINNQFGSYKTPKDKIPDPIQGDRYSAKLEPTGFVYVSRDGHEKPENYSDLGWKFHLAIDDLAGWDIVKEVLIKNDVNYFKLANPASYPDGRMKGRDITIYPNHENPPRDWVNDGEYGKSWQSIITEITVALYNAGIAPCAIAPDSTNQGRGSIERFVNGSPYVTYRHDEGMYHYGIEEEGKGIHKSPYIGLDRYFLNPEDGPKSIVVNTGLDLQPGIENPEKRPTPPENYIPGVNAGEFELDRQLIQEEMLHLKKVTNNTYIYPKNDERVIQPTPTPKEFTPRRRFERPTEETLEKIRRKQYEGSTSEPKSVSSNDSESEKSLYRARTRHVKEPPSKDFLEKMREKEVQEGFNSNDTTDEFKPEKSGFNRQRSHHVKEPPSKDFLEKMSEKEVQEGFNSNDTTDEFKPEKSLFTKTRIRRVEERPFDNYLGRSRQTDRTNVEPNSSTVYQTSDNESLKTRSSDVDFTSTDDHNPLSVSSESEGNKEQSTWVKFKKPIKSERQTDESSTKITMLLGGTQRDKVQFTPIEDEDPVLQSSSIEKTDDKKSLQTVSSPSQTQTTTVQPKETQTDQKGTEEDKNKRFGNF